MKKKSHYAPLSILFVAMLAAGCSHKGKKANTTGGAMSETLDNVDTWVRTNSKDVGSLELSSTAPEFAGALDGFVERDVDLMGLGENAHGTREYNQLRSKVFKYLVENHGYRAIIPETGIIEARLADQYVQGAPNADLTSALFEGFTHGMGRAEEARELLVWMRTYNQGKRPEQRVHFAGKDLSILGDTLIVPLAPLVAYLRKVDPKLASSKATAATMQLAQKASAVTLRVEAAFKAKGAHEIEPDFLDAVTTISFEQLSAKEQLALENGVSDLSRRVATNAARYTAASSDEDYQWHAQLAVVATQLMRDLRSRQTYPKIFQYDKVSGLLAAHLPDVVVDKRPASDPRSHSMELTSAEHLRNQYLARESRERSLAENVGWVQKRYGKTLNFAHIGHVNKLGLEKIKAFGVEFGDAGRAEGEFLAESYGKRYALIGTTSIDFKDRDGKPVTKFQGAPVIRVEDQPESFEHDLVDLVRPRNVGVFIDLKHARALPRAFGKRQFRWNDSFQELDLQGNYDGMFVLSAVRPQRDIE